MRVFRIETKAGCGVCQSSGLCSLYHTICKTPCLDNGFEDEHLVAKRLFNNGWKFGFPTMDKLVAWFPNKEGRELMQDYGDARIVEYETPEDIDGIGDTQVLFNFPKAKKVAEYDVVTLAAVNA